MPNFNRIKKEFIERLQENPIKIACKTPAAPHSKLQMSRKNSNRIDSPTRKMLMSKLGSEYLTFDDDQAFDNTNNYNDINEYAFKSQLSEEMLIFI